MTYAKGKHYESLDEMRADFPNHDITKNGSTYTGWLRTPEWMRTPDRNEHVGHLRVNHDLDVLAADLAEHLAAVEAKAAAEDPS